MQRHIHNHKKPTYSNIEDVAKMGCCTMKQTLIQRQNTKQNAVPKQSCGSLEISTSRKEQNRVGIKENKLQPHSLHGTVMIEDFNLLATTARGNERAMCNELYFLLKDNLQDADAKTSKTKIRGLIVAKTALEPVGVMEKFRCILTEQPYAFRYALRIVPIERVVPTELEAIKKAAAELAAPKIGEGQSFRITVEKRYTEIHSKDIIEAAVGDIKAKVDLHNPDWIIQIEVLGGLTGVSLLRPTDVLAVVKEKML
jgi:tRNA acetyltransferase TAN1